MQIWVKRARKLTQGGDEAELRNAHANRTRVTGVVGGVPLAFLNFRVWPYSEV